MTNNMTPPQNKKYLFFLDETGDHGLTFIDENFPIFLLAGCLFEDAEYRRVSEPQPKQMELV